jgi:hypothetical protein
MRAGSSRDPRKDDILRPIFGAHGEDQDPRWRTILLVIFWPGLEGIHRKKQHWDPAPDTLWSNITWGFLETVCRIDTRERPNRLVQKIINDTIHRLYGEYRHEWRRVEREVSLETDEFERLAGGDEGLEMAAVELLDEKEFEVRELKRYLASGVISEADFFLALGTIVYGASLSEYSEQAGLSYETVKKRRQRLEAKIRRHAKNS